MFTGIVERTLTIRSVHDHPGGRQLVVDRVWDDAKHGESIAINGCCLTIAKLEKDSIRFDLIQETLNKTNLGALKPGDNVNVERAMQIGSRFDGHFVQGHVDGTGELVKLLADESQWRLTIEVPDQLSKYLSPKGSVCVDGISLTIAALNGNRFDVAIIPTTLEITTLRHKHMADRVNIECDMIAKQIVSFMELRGT